MLIGLSLYLRPVHTNSEEILKRCVLSEKTNQVFFFCAHYAGEISKGNNHRPFWICVRGKLGQGNHVIIVLLKSSVFEVFSVHTERKAGVFKFLWFEERFPKAPFS